MSILDKLTQQGSPLSVGNGSRPNIPQNVTPQSQVMAQGEPGSMEMKAGHSIHDLDGLRPNIPQNATPQSQVMAQGEPGSMVMKPGHSVHDIQFLPLGSSMYRFNDWL